MAAPRWTGPTACSRSRTRTDPTHGRSASRSPARGIRRPALRGGMPSHAPSHRIDNQHKLADLQRVLRIKEVHRMMRSIIRKPIVFVAMLMIAAGVLAACTTGDDGQPGATGPGATSVPASSVPAAAPSDAAEPGANVLKTLDPDFDATYRITMDLLDGYAEDEGDHVVFGTDGGQ